MISINIFVLSCIIMFGLGILAGRQQGKDICMEKIQVIIKEYGLAEENAGDA